MSHFEQKKILADDFKKLVEDKIYKLSWGHIFSHVQPSYERAVSDLDRPMHISLFV